MAGGAEEELAEVECAAVDVAADEVFVHGLEGLGRGDVAGENAVAEAGGEALDLGFDAIGHVECGAVGEVAIGPEDVAVLRCAGGVAEGWLGDEDEGSFRVLTAEDGGFGIGDFFERAAEVEGEGIAALGRAPGDGLGEGVVDFEGGGAVAKALELARVVGGEAIAGYAQELARCEIAEGERLRVGQVVEGVDATAGVECAVELSQAGDEGAGNGLRTAARNGPADAVSGGGEYEADGAAEG